MARRYESPGWRKTLYRQLSAAGIAKVSFRGRGWNHAANSKWGTKMSAIRSPEAGDMRKPGAKMPSGNKPRDTDGFMSKP
jgi:hypothetical protein